MKTITTDGITEKPSVIEATMMKKGTVLAPGRYYLLANDEIGIIGSPLKVKGKGFIGMTCGGMAMPRWWDEEGVDNRDKHFNIIKEVPNPYANHNKGCA